MKKSAYLQITRRCNNKCIFCSNPEFNKDYSLEKSKETILKFKKEGITEITLTGGEPTIVDFILDLVKFIKSKNLDIKMVSNGVNLCDDELTRKLYESGLKKVTISFHSSIQKIADKLSQKKGNYKRTLKGIYNLLKTGFEVEINSTINSLNCNHLLKNASFLVKNFPKIKHYIFNNLDPGNADSKIRSRAGENPWIVPKFIDFELELHKTLKFLKKNKKTFRVERVPLCYLIGFEQYNTETRKIIKNEKYICSFLNKNKNENTIHKITPIKLRKKVNLCKYCKYNPICCGIDPYYLKIHGKKEIYPVFEKPEKIIDNIKNEI